MAQLKIAMLINNISPEEFTWLRWVSGSPHFFFPNGQKCSESSFVEYRSLFKKYAIGKCRGDLVPCRPKLNHVAVMFYMNNKHFWFHVSLKEFGEIFV